MLERVNTTNSQRWRQVDNVGTCVTQQIHNNDDAIWTTQYGQDDLTFSLKLSQGLREVFQI